MPMMFEFVLINVINDKKREKGKHTMADDIRLTCPYCKQSLEAPKEMTGIEIKCPKCSNIIIIPKIIPTRVGIPTNVVVPKTVPQQKKPSKILSGIPNTLGLFLGVIAMINARGFGKLGAALTVFFVYLTGWGIGHVIEKLTISRKWKVVIAATIGVIIGGGFIFTKALLDARSHLAEPLSSATNITKTTGLANNISTQALYVDEILQGFPELSLKAKSEFKKRVTISGMSKDKVLTTLQQVMSEGEQLLPKKDQDEIAILYRKAVDTLSVKEQMLISSVSLKMSQGEECSIEEQQKISGLVQQGFANLSTQDSNRYLQLRIKSIELALTKEE